MTVCLIVDDEEQNRYLLEILLKSHGYQAVTAKNGQDALQKACANPPDLIISDIMMPLMDGFEFCRECKLNKSLKDIPFVFYTAHYTEDKDEKLALAVGADQFIVKPQDPIMFLELIKEALFYHHKKQELVKPELDQEEYLTAHRERLVKNLEKKMTELEQLNRALQDSEANFRNFLDDSPLGARIVTNSGETLYANQALLDIYGYETLEELRGTTAKERYTPDTYQAFLSRREKRRRGEPVATGYEVGIVRKDGAIRRLQVFRKEIIWNGEAQFQVLYYDVTERKKAEEKIRKSEASLKAAQEQAHIGSWEINLSTGEHFWSDEMYRIVEYSALAEPPDFEILCQKMHSYDVERVLEGFKQAIGEQKTLQDEYCLVFADGRVKFIEARGAPIFDEAGRITHYAGTVQDITQRKHSENERAELQEQLLQSRKLEAVGVLASGIAHDFNNILGAISGYAEITIEKMQPDDPLRKNLEKIMDATQRSSNITRQLLAFARKQVISPVLLDLRNSVENTLKMLRRLIGENIELEWKPGKNYCQALMDPSQLDQVLLNLCVNARDAIGSIGKVIIEMDTVSFDQPYALSHTDVPAGQYVLLAVSDNGCGMDAQTTKHVFEPFFTTKNLGEGTGMGLATVYGIVKQSEGHVHVYSEPGIGTTFKIYLPLREEEPVKEKKAATDGLPRGLGEKIMLVDDEPAILEMTAMMLNSLGYDVLVASRPGKALDLAAACETTIQLAITDVVMPEMNGRELVSRLLSMQPEMRYLFISGYTADIIEGQGVPDCNRNFLAKPFSMKDLARKIRDILE